MKELINKVMITGELVEIDITEDEKKGNEYIRGNLILRTADKSEHKVDFFAYKYKKDENKNFTSEESYFYKEYISMKENFKDLKNCSDGERPDIVSITDGMFTDNDYKGKDGNVYSSNGISVRFINKVEPKDYESTVLEAKFEVEGIIEKIEDEIVKNEPTGNLIVVLNAIGQKSDGFGKDANYTADKLIPVRMKVDKSMATAFRQAGYYDGSFTKLVGKLVNAVEIVEVVEKAAFGSDITKTFKNTIKKNEIQSGTTPSSIFENELTQEIVDALKAKRKAKLEEVKNGSSVNHNDELSFAPDKSNPAPQMAYNPFAQH